MVIPRKSIKHALHRRWITAGCWQFHTQVQLVDYRCKVDKGVAAENGIVGVVDVYHIEGDCFCSLGTPFAERDVQLYSAEGLYSFASEANERVL